MRWGKLTRNPGELAKPPARGRSRAQAWTAIELRAFLECTGGDRLAACWRLATTTGASRGELLGVTWRALDLDAASLTIERQLTRVRGRLVFGPPKSQRGDDRARRCSGLALARR
jgi:integrase